MKQACENAALTVRLDIRDLDLESGDGRWTDIVDFGILLQSAEGKVLQNSGNAIQLNLTDSEREKRLETGVVLRQRIEALPGVSQIRIAVMDQASGRIGTLRIVPPAKQ